MLKPLALLLTLGLLCHNAFAHQSSISVDAKERKAVVERVSTLMINNYVSEVVARKTAAHIQKQLKNGAYDNISQGEEFATKLTGDVQSINHDKHMRIRVQQPRSAHDSNSAKAEPESPLVHVFLNQQHNRQGNNGHQKVEILDGNVGYMDFRMFGDSDAAKQKATTALAYLEDTDAMIIDLRKNGGGSPDTVRFICSYFFGERTHLNSLYWRQGDRTEEFWTLDEIPGKRRPDVPLYVLTSDYTFSGAEEFSYNMQSRKRATLVGETTGGGANTGGKMTIDNGLGGENEVNMLGYDFLQQQSNPDMAVLVFSFNTLRFPGSSNAFDSLGEAYLKAGNDKLAKKSYLKSLALNPQNDNAKSMIKGL